MERRVFVELIPHRLSMTVRLARGSTLDHHGRVQPLSLRHDAVGRCFRVSEQWPLLWCDTPLAGHVGHVASVLPSTTCAHVVWNFTIFATLPLANHCPSSCLPIMTITLPCLSLFLSLASPSPYALPLTVTRTLNPDPPIHFFFFLPASQPFPVQLQVTRPVRPLPSQTQNQSIASPSPSSSPAIAR